jgi:PAT family beta-lactamase induction signal transducer AmpG
MAEQQQLERKKSGWWWIPSLYYAEGIPYNIAMVVSVVMYKTLGISNAAIAFWTSILYLPWTIKPLWSPFIDVVWTKRRWVIWMQFTLALIFLAIGIVMQLPFYFPVSIALLWIVAFASATHDIAADGFYMLGLSEHEQAWFVGIRSTFYRLATITAVGLLVMFAGYIQTHTGLEAVSFDVNAVPDIQVQSIDPQAIQVVAESGKPRILHFPEEINIPVKSESVDTVDVYFILSGKPQNEKVVTVNFGKKKGSPDILLLSGNRFEFSRQNWNIPQRAILSLNRNLKEAATAEFAATAGDVPLSWTFSFGLLAVMLLVFGLYHKFILPKPYDESSSTTKEIFASYVDVFRTFFQKKGIIAGILFLLFYRLAESQLIKLASPFLLDARENSGLALATSQVGIAYGTVGIIMLLLGGLLGGFVAAKQGLKKWIWWMALAINIPDLVYVFMSHTMPDSFATVVTCVGIEQFGYGFGFTGYMLFMIYLAEGKYKTSHYAIATAFMALGMMIPGMISGAIQEWLGYQRFFVYVMMCTVPSFLILLFIKIDPSFGMRKEVATR